MHFNRHINNLRGHSTNVTCFTKAKYEMIGASGSEDGIIIFWNLEKYIKIVKIKAHTESVVSLDFPPKSDKLLSISFNEIKLWEVKSFNCLFSLEIPPNKLLQKSIFSSNGEYFITAFSNTLTIWDA